MSHKATTVELYCLLAGIESKWTVRTNDSGSLIVEDEHGDLKGFIILRDGNAKFTEYLPPLSERTGYEGMRPLENADE